MKSVIYVGMDVHSKTISLCAYNPKKEWYGHQCQIETDSKLVWKYAQKLLADEGEPGDNSRRIHPKTTIKYFFRFQV